MFLEGDFLEAVKVNSLLLLLVSCKSKMSSLFVTLCDLLFYSLAMAWIGLFVYSVC